VSSLTLSLYGLLVAQLVIAVLSSVAMTSEYATGAITTSVAAVPRRVRLVAAKAVVVSLVAFVAGTVAALGMVFAGQLSFDGPGGGPFAPMHLSDPEVVRAIVGAGLYLAVLAVLSLAVGVVVRWTAAAVALLVFAILIVPAMFESLPAPWSGILAAYWPTNAGLQIVLSGPDGPVPWAGLALLAGFTTVFLAAACGVFRRRDV
jgi:ABC-type transport system involved in multi-copper enzyme maturation permease subunit